MDNEQRRVREVTDTTISNYLVLLKNMNPKLHVAGEHAANHDKILTPGFLWLLVEYWVELNHQQGYRIEQQFKHIPGHK